HFGVLGPAGNAIRHGGGRLFGWGEDVIPACLIAGGVLLVLERALRGLAGTLASSLLLLLASAGLADLAGGNPSTGSSLGRLAGAGGIVGAGLGGGMAKIIGIAGAGVVLGVIAFTAICWLLGGRVVAVIRSGVTAVASGTKRSVEHLRHVRSHTLAAAQAEAAARQARPTTVTPYDYEGSMAPLRSEPVLDPIEPPAQPEPDPAADDGPAATDAPHPLPVVFAGGMLDPALSEHSRPEQLSLPVPLPNTNWRLPAAKLLKRSKDQAHDRREIESRGRVLERALAAHGVETHLVGFTVGPTVTRFELELGAGVKVARVTNLAKDIAYAMASPDVRILAPIPGRSAIGVEVPNQNRQLVTLGDVLATNDARRAVHPLEVGLGRDIAGRAIMVNLAEMPHLLIAGATGAGKSSCINSLVTSILMRATPEEVRLILVDPKRVELGQYNGLPHLLTQVVVNPKRAANALNWAVAEMERRYDLLAEAGMRDITGYNAAVDRGDFADPLEHGDVEGEPEPGAGLAGGLVGPSAALALAGTSGGLAEHAAGLDEAIGGAGRAETTGPAASDADEDDHAGDYLLGGDPVPASAAVGLSDGSVSAGVAAMVQESRARSENRPQAAYARLPFILIVVDELNDLMMVAARDVEESICRIAQMARAVGIHLVIATQRPSVDVITGVIKANVPSRLAFSVSSLADSRVILDQPGAERLIGRGDLLLLTASSSVPRRLQGPWVGEDEVRGVVAHWRRQSGPQYVDGVEGEQAGPGSAGGVEDDDEELLGSAMELVVRSQLGSTSMLQRKLRVGFARAGRLMDLLERRGVVGPSEGSKARAVLMTSEELDALDR
ncbi:MAG TPA: DNA translocase FtsK, partial [Acidimicrobiales bacterium]|nr:DNA translocase FtsK [Acidimicrobiales bacterium]